MELISNLLLHISFFTILFQPYYEGENELTGAIPSQLGQATGLKELSIGDNKLNGTIPTQIGSIATLQQLDIGGNDLNGTIPTEIGSLSNLTVLSVGKFYDILIST